MLLLGVGPGVGGLSGGEVMSQDLHMKNLRFLDELQGEGLGEASRRFGFQELSGWRRFGGISYYYMAVQGLEMRACKLRRDRNPAGASKPIWS